MSIRDATRKSQSPPRVHTPPPRPPATPDSHSCAFLRDLHSSPLTGLEIARSAGIPVLIGEANAYYWWRPSIILRPSVARTSTPFAQLCAAHEVAHHAQNLELPWLRWCRWFEPIRWWSEFDAWRRAIEALA